MISIVFIYNSKKALTEQNEDHLDFIRNESWSIIERLRRKKKMENYFATMLEDFRH